MAETADCERKFWATPIIERTLCDVARARAISVFRSSECESKSDVVVTPRFLNMRNRARFVFGEIRTNSLQNKFFRATNDYSALAHQRGLRATLPRLARAL
jgi:hypothetical protein